VNQVGALLGKRSIYLTELLPNSWKYTYKNKRKGLTDEEEFIRYRYPVLFIREEWNKKYPNCNYAVHPDPGINVKEQQLLS